MGITLGGATCILTYTHHTDSEFSEKVVRTTLTNKTVSWLSNVILFSGESIEARYWPALAHKFSQKGAWAPTFSTRSIFITISWDFSHRSERYWSWTALFLTTKPGKTSSYLQKRKVLINATKQQKQTNILIKVMDAKKNALFQCNCYNADRKYSCL